MSNRNQRNHQLTSQIGENNPFKKTLAPALLDISGAFAKDMKAVGAEQDLSVKGKRDKAREHLREALRARQDRLKPLKEYEAQTAAMKVKVRLPDYSKDGGYAARLRAEIRDRSYDMTPLQRIGLMTGPTRSVAFLDAVFEQQPFVSGLREKSELDVLATAKTERLAELHGTLQAAIAERESTESEILMIDNMVLNDLADDSGLSRDDFKAEAKAFESKAAALTEAPKTEDRKPTTLEQRGPEFEAIWERFDRMVDASVA